MGYVTKNRTRSCHRIRLHQCRLLLVKILLCENALVQKFFDLLETLYELGIHPAGAAWCGELVTEQRYNLSDTDVKTGVKRKVLGLQKSRK